MVRSENPLIAKAFEQVSRRHFVVPQDAKRAQLDQPLPIGHGQTISQPTTVAMMLEWLDPRLGHRVLDVGSGSGWTTALLATIVGPSGSVIGVERIPELVEFGRKNLEPLRLNQARIAPAGPVPGWPKDAPYDRILVSAAAAAVPPELVDQLKPGGRMVVPVQQSVRVIEKDEQSRVHQTDHPGFAFVPLVE